MRFNPYIRGCNSADLCSISSENGRFFVKDTIALTKQGKAPISREIGKGGTTSSLFKEPGLAFSTLLETSLYTLDKVKEYADMPIEIRSWEIEDQEIEKYQDITYFSRKIFDLIIEYSRAKQMGIEILSRKQLEALNTYSDIMQDLISFFQLYGTKIFINPDLISIRKIDSMLSAFKEETIDTKFSNKNFSKYLRENKGIFTKAQQDSSEENISAIIHSLNQYLLKDNAFQNTPSEPLSSEQLKHMSAQYPTIDLSLFWNEIGVSEGIVKIFASNYSNNRDSIFNEDLKHNVEVAITALNNIFNANIEEYKISDQDKKDYVYDIFPMIYILTKHDDIILTQNEFRCPTQLELGVDIKTIATSKDGVPKLHNFLKIRNLEQKVNIILIEELEYFTQCEIEDAHPKPIIFQENDTYLLPTEDQFIELDIIGST